jgi:sulfopyruvate decarboxylase subunit beta
VNRLDALRVVDEVFGEDPIVATCGATARELASLGLRDSCLPLLDSMGLTSAIGLGVALGSSRPVGVIDGDGSLLMGFSIVPTLACVAPGNLTLLVLDNGSHASADGMPSQAQALDLTRAIAGCGIRTVEVADVDALAVELRAAVDDGSFSAIVGRIEQGNAAGIDFLLEDAAALGDRFRRSLARRER